MDHLRFVKACRVSNINFFDEIFTEVTKYLDNLKTKALTFREDILAIKEAVCYIKNLEDRIVDPIKSKFDKKCTHFIVIENGLNAILYNHLLNENRN